MNRPAVRDSAHQSELPRARQQACWAGWCAVAALVLALSGCGSTISRSATEQLLASSAVDLAVAQIDFSSMSGRTVFFDKTYIQTIKGIGFVNGDYIVSAIRQQLVAARCLLEDDRNKAEFIVEARVGALGTDGHDITYGIPASNGLNTAASMVPSLPQIPTIPEISIAKKTDQSAASKISVFAYHRETREPVWQSGLSEGYASAKDLWVAGAGPFQSGTIYDTPQFAGQRIRVPFFGKQPEVKDRGPVGYFAEHRFDAAATIAAEADGNQEIKQTSGNSEATSGEGASEANPAAPSTETTGEQSPATDTTKPAAGEPQRTFSPDASLLLATPAPEIFIPAPVPRSVEPIEPPRRRGVLNRPFFEPVRSLFRR